MLFLSMKPLKFYLSINSMPTIMY